MNLATFSVKRPIAAGIISVAIFILGLYSRANMPVALYPELSLPFISVTVPFPGAAPEQIEEKVIKPLEKELASVKGINRVFGFIKPSVGVIIMQFKMSVNEREAFDNVREKVAAVRAALPTDIDEPVVRRLDVGATPVLIYGIEGAESPEVLKDRLDDSIVRSLQRTDGVNDANIIGLGDAELEIALDAQALNSLRVAPLEIFNYLKANLATVPWGDVVQKDHLLTVTRGIMPADLDYWNNFNVTLADGRVIRLGEVGVARHIRDQEATKVMINGKPGLGLIITKRSEANTLDTVAKVKKTLERDTPSGIKLFPIIDQSQYIQENAHEVWIALFIGGFFAVLTILVFLTDLRSAMITATALPVSVAGTFIFMSYMGFSINMMSLLALSLAIGLLIDDAVVVREAIFSEMESGKTPAEAAVAGTNKVQTAVLATTLAVIAVFIPVSAMSGMVGQFFKEFGFTIVIAVSLSLWVAFTLDPMLSAHFGGEHKLLQGAGWDRWRATLTRAEERAGLAARWAFHHPIKVIASTIAMFVISLLLIASRGADFLAVEDRGQMVVNLAAPLGSSKTSVEAMAADAYTRLKGLEGLTDIFASLSSPVDKLKTEMRLVFVPKNKRDKGILTLQDEARQRLEGLTGASIVLPPPPIEGIGTEAPLQIYIYGEDLKALGAEAERIAVAARKLPGIAQVRVETSPASPSIAVSLDSSEMTHLATNSNAVEFTGRLALTGIEAGSVGNKNTPLFVRLQDKDRNLAAVWDSLLVPGARGPVQLSQVATATEGESPSRIDREKRLRKAVIWGTMDGKNSYNQVLASLESLLKTIEAPMHAEIGGDKELFEEMINNFSMAIIGAGFFIFVILAIQFENLLRPFVILLTLPMAIIGAFLALFIVGQKLAMGSLIGLILLIGLAAKNGILLVDAIGEKEKHLDQLTAIQKSAQERFRPIVMTSVAMIFGMLPTALMRGGGSEFRSPMAIGIIGGVVSSTILTLIVVPSIFGLIARFRRPRGKALGAALVILGTGLGLGLGNNEAHAAAVVAARSTKREANMDELRKVLAIRPAADSSAGLTTQAMREAADGFTDASRQAFFGGLRLEADKQWIRPGVQQSITLPLPPAVGGPVTSSMTLVPKEQTIYSIGWAIPLFNMQAFRAVPAAQRGREQVELVAQAERESSSQREVQLLLAHELAQESLRLFELRAKIADQRFSTVRARAAAGSARRIEQAQAQASVEASYANLEAAKSEMVRSRLAYETEVDKPLPTEGFGMPRFPFAGGKPFAPQALKALDGALAMEEAMLDVRAGAYYPTVDLSAMHQIKEYEGAPKPQNIVSLKLTWDLLDAGVRRKNMGLQQQSLFMSRARREQALTQLKLAYDTLDIRHQGMQNSLKAAKASQSAASIASQDAATSYRAGVARLEDVRTADETRIGAELAIIQAEAQLQAIAFESLLLTGSWESYLSLGAVEN